MKVFLSVLSDVVWIEARAAHGEIEGDLAHPIRAGQEYLGYTYEELRRLGDGEHELKTKQPVDAT
jgi:hypothetical protein